MNLHLLLREDIAFSADFLLTLSELLGDYRTSKPELTLEESRRIRALQTDLIQKASDLNGQTIRDLMADLEEPKKRLQQAIAKAEEVIKNLKEVNRVLGIVATLIEAFNRISLGLASGGLVLIESLVKSIDELARE
jgi:DNA repair exonuclease SbcCD ATPase subunit